MSESSAPHHDQRLKVLLKEFFEQFFLCIAKFLNLARPRARTAASLIAGDLS
jgi:hypothetical protein